MEVEPSVEQKTNEINGNEWNSKIRFRENYEEVSASKRSCTGSLEDANVFQEASNYYIHENILVDKDENVVDFVSLQNYNFDPNIKNTIYIFNQIEFDVRNNQILSRRDGTEKDVNKITTCFEKINYNVETEHDFTVDQIMEKINDIAKSDQKRNMLIIIFLTHGHSDGILSAKDAHFNIKSIWQKFTANNCPALATKPKWFIFQACKGDHFSLGAKARIDHDGDSSSQIKNGNGDDRKEIIVPSEADILLSFSTIEGAASCRNLYFNVLCEFITNCAQSEHVIDILTKAANDVAYRYNFTKIHEAKKYKQIPSYFSTLTKKFFLVQQFPKQNLNDIFSNESISPHLKRFFEWAAVEMQTLSPRELDISKKHINCQIEERIETMRPSQ